MVRVSLRSFVVLCVVAVTMVIVGCGSSDDGSTADTETAASGPPLSVAAYGKEAEAICRKTGERQTKATEKIVAENPPNSSDQAELAALTTEAAKPIFHGMVEELEALALPSGKKGEQFGEWVEAVDEAVAKIDAPPAEAVDATVNAHHKAKRVGLQVCSLL
jgi:hypothetical protein